MRSIREHLKKIGDNSESNPNFDPCLFPFIFVKILNRSTAMLENFNEDKRKNSMAQFSDFHTGWSITKKQMLLNKTKNKEIFLHVFFILFICHKKLC